MPQQTKAMTDTLIVVTGKISPVVQRLSELLGGPQAVKIYSAHLPSQRIGKRNKLDLLKQAWLKLFVVPFQLSLSITKYKRVILYFNRSAYSLGIWNFLLPKPQRAYMIWIGFAPTPQRSTINGWIRDLITNLSLRGFNLVICHSKPLLQSLQQRFPKAIDKLVYVPWSGSDNSSNCSYQVTDEGYVFCGGLTNRDFETVVAAVRELSVPTKLVMRADVKLRGEIAENIQIYRDIPGQQFQELMAKAKIVVIALDRPEIASGQLVLNKAMQFAKPVLVTDIAGISDYVSDGYDACLVRPHDPVDLRNKLEMLLADPNLCLQLGQNGYSATERYNSNTFAQQLVQLIKQKND